MEIKGKCRKHGELNNNTGFLSKDSAAKSGLRLRCKKCCHENRVSYYYRNQKETIKKVSEWKKNNRERINEQTRIDRKLNPEKYKIWSANLRKKTGEVLTHKEICRRRKINLNDYYKLFELQNNKCAICNNEETRIAKNGKLSRLCLDHNHETGKIRQLLCHDCNTMIGKAKEDINILQAAIEYLNKHK